MKIIIADSREEVRSALRLLIEQEPVFTVIDEAAGVEELKSKMQALEPDLLLLDWELPGIRFSPAGLTAKLLGELRSLNARVKIVAMSSRPESRQVALSAGVEVFISKVDSPEHLLATLQSIAASCAVGDNDY